MDLYFFFAYQKFPILMFLIFEIKEHISFLVNECSGNERIDFVPKKIKKLKKKEKKKKYMY